MFLKRGMVLFGHRVRVDGRTTLRVSGVPHEATAAHIVSCGRECQARWVVVHAAGAVVQQHRHAALTVVLEPHDQAAVERVVREAPRRLLQRLDLDAVLTAVQDASDAIYELPVIPEHLRLFRGAVLRAELRGA